MWRADWCGTSTVNILQIVDIDFKSHKNNPQNNNYFLLINRTMLINQPTNDISNPKNDKNTYKKYIIPSIELIFVEINPERIPVKNIIKPKKNIFFEFLRVIIPNFIMILLCQ